MAISHPLYDLLVRGDQATFFIAHQAKAVDIYLLVMLLSVVLPLALFLMICLLNLISRHLGRILHATVIFALFALLFMSASQKAFGSLGWTNVGIGVGAAVISTLAFAVSHWVRFFIGLAAVGALVSPILFLTSPAMQSFLATPDAQDYRLELSGQDYPDVVMIVFDEFPLISLLDEDRRIDEVRFPNFARLAKTSTWYRNTVAAHTTTAKAIPSMLTGRYINQHRPVAGSETYPENLVSFLGSTHQLRGVEIVTEFFNASEKGNVTPGFRFRFTNLGMDLLVVLGHVALPDALSGQLPAIDRQWSGFLNTSEPSGRAPAKGPLLVRRFLDLLRTTPRSTPAFFYLHMLLPHSPLRFNDDGRSVGNELSGYGLGTRSATAHTFAKNEQDALLIYQAHLLQTRFVDLILGNILDELKTLGLFDDSLIVVTSDHGIGYVWYENSPSNLFALRAGEVYWVPFFLKKPGQTQGEIVDDRVVTLDIFPTIAEVLDREIPWPVDGISAIGPSAARNARENTGNPDKRETWLPDSEQEFAALDTKIALFGQHNLEDLYFYGPNKDLIGRRADSLAIAAGGEAPGTAKLLTPTRLDSTMNAMPFYLKGKLTSISPGFDPRDLDLAIAINGVIWGTTRSRLEDKKGYFITRIPMEAWKTGENAVSIYAIVGNKENQEVQLARFGMDGSN